MHAPAGWESEQQSYWEEQDRRRSPTHPVVEAFARPKVDYVFSAIARHRPDSDFSGWRVLDVGCGNGYFTQQLVKRAHTVGLDFSATMLAQHPASDLVRGSTLALPFADDTFDLVVCSNLLHHIKVPRDAVREMARVSRGYVALSEPNCHHPAMVLFHGLVPEERGALKFNRGYLRRLLAEGGLHEIASSSQGSVLPNKCPAPLLPLFRPFDRMIFCKLYCVAVGAVRG